MERNRVLYSAWSQLLLPWLDTSGGRWQPPKPSLPTVKTVVANLNRIAGMFEVGDVPERDRTDWKLEQEERREQMGLVKRVQKMSKSDWASIRKRFLGERGTDFETLVLLRAHERGDTEDLQVFGQKARQQIEALELLTRHSPSARRQAAEVLLSIAKFATRAVNDLAMEANDTMLMEAKKSDAWPLLASPHGRVLKDAERWLKSLDVGVDNLTRIEEKARSKRDDPAGKLAVLIVEHINGWRVRHHALLQEDWFEQGLKAYAESRQAKTAQGAKSKSTDWTNVLCNLPEFDTSSVKRWVSVADALLIHSYGAAASGRRLCGEQNYLGRFLKNRKSKPLTYRLARQALLSRIKGLAPA